MATHLRHLITVAAALIAVAVAAAPAAAETVFTRVEGPDHTVFHNTVVPTTGTLTDQNGDPHTTSTETVLGALVTASHRRGFPLDLVWYDLGGGGWTGFFVNAVDGVAGDSSHFWALKIKHRLAAAGAGAIPARTGVGVLYYYTSFDPITYQTQHTLGIRTGDRTIAAGGTVAVSITSYDDAGVGEPSAAARVRVNGRVVAVTDTAGVATVEFPRAGTFQMRATGPGEIRSRRWTVTVNSA